MYTSKTLRRFEESIAGSGRSESVDDERGSWDDMPTTEGSNMVLSASLKACCRGGSGGGFPVEVAPCWVVQAAGAGDVIITCRDVSGCADSYTSSMVDAVDILRNAETEVNFSVQCCVQPRCLDSANSRRKRGNRARHAKDRRVSHQSHVQIRQLAFLNRQTDTLQHALTSLSFCSLLHVKIAPTALHRETTVGSIGVYCTPRYQLRGDWTAS